MNQSDPQFIDDSIRVSYDEFKCVVCKDLKIDLLCPKYCMHPTCVECHGMLVINAQDGTCPVCRDHVREWVPHKFAIRLITGIKTKCQYVGCDITCELGVYNDHIKKCIHRTTKCSHARSGCTWSGSWVTSLAHGEACSFVPQTCEHCKNLFVRGALAAHVQNCNYIRYTCGYCKISMPHWQTTDHQCEQEHAERLNLALSSVEQQFINQNQFTRTPAVENLHYINNYVVDDLSQDAINQLAINDIV